MAKYEMEVVFEYAKVFPENADMGDPNGNKVQQQIYKDGGKTSVNVYFTSEDQINQLEEDGLEMQPMGYERIKNGNPEFGIGKFMNLKRPVPDKIFTFENKTGTKEVNNGGFPKVVDMRDGRENRRLWDFEEGGAIGNGSKGLVQFETYSNGAGVKLTAIGIEELVPYEPVGEHFEAL